MNLTLKTLLEAQPALGALCSAKLVDVRTAFRLGRFAAKAREETGRFQQIREDLIRELGTESEGGRVEITEPEKQAEFYERITPLLGEEIELDVPEITIEALAGASLSANEIATLDWLIKE